MMDIPVIEISERVLWNMTIFRIPLKEIRVTREYLKRQGIDVPKQYVNYVFKLHPNGTTLFPLIIDESLSAQRLSYQVLYQNGKRNEG